MNRKAKGSFIRIQGAAAAYKAAVVEAMREYRAEEERARQDAAQYKDEETRFAEAKAGIVSATRRRLDTAREKLTENVNAEMDSLRGVLRDHAIVQPAPVYVEKLKSYADFNLKPTETEISALLELNGGAALGLRMLNATLEKVHSPYRIDCTDVATFERDIAALGKLGDQAVAYAPLDFHRDMCRLYEGTPRLINGTNFGYKWDSISLIVQTQLFEAAVDGLESMAERWSAETVPSITQLQEIYSDSTDATAAEQYDADREAVTDAAQIVEDEDAGTRYAAELAKTVAQADQRAKEVLAHYTA